MAKLASKGKIHVEWDVSQVGNADASSDWVSVSNPDDDGSWPKAYP